MYTQLQARSLSHKVAVPDTFASVVRPCSRPSSLVVVLTLFSLDGRLYTLHELASTLTVQAIPSAPNGTSTIISTASIIPANPPASAVWAAAEIMIPPPSLRFPKQYIYVSNRNTGVQTPTGDSVAIFENLDQGTPRERLQLVKQVFTGLDQIRGMQFGGEGDEYLIAGGVAGTAGVVIYRRVDGGRDLEEVVRNTDVPTRTSFVWTS